jgi:hypothetical protein
MSTDALVAALLGALVEIEGYTPRFVSGDETPREALRRVRPGVALVDCDFPGACTAAFLGPAKMVGARVVLFGRPTVAAIVAACAEQFELRVLGMPPASGELARALSGGG